MLENERIEHDAEKEGQREAFLRSSEDSRLNWACVAESFGKLRVLEAAAQVAHWEDFRYTVSPDADSEVEKEREWQELSYLLRQTVVVLRWPQCVSNKVNLVTPVNAEEANEANNEQDRHAS